MWMNLALVGMMGCAHTANEAVLPMQRFAEVPPAEQNQQSHARIDAVKAATGALSEQIEGILKDKEIPGAAVAVVVDGQRVWSQGFGVKNRETKAPMTPQTVSRIGSISKVFTGLAVMKLQDEGRVRLDDPVIGVIPELAGVVYPSSDSPRITFQHLLTHTSGLPRVGTLDYYSDPDAPVTEASLAAALQGTHLNFAPGTDTVYSNLAMGVAGWAVGRIAGSSLRAYLATDILGPLGMNATTFVLEDVAQERLATGYEKTSEGLVASPHWNLGLAEGMGGMYSTAEDMSAFAAWQLSAWPARSAPDAGPVRRSTVRATQLALGGGDPDYTFGANWAVRPHEQSGWIVSHNGATHQYSATIRLAPREGFGLVVLANTGQPASDQIAKVVFKSVQEALPEVEQPLPQSLRVASQAFMKELATPTPESIEQVFSASFLKAISVDQLIGFFSKISSDVGGCTLESGKLKSAGKGEFILQCEKARLKADLTAETSPPHHILGLNITSADE